MLLLLVAPRPMILFASGFGTSPHLLMPIRQIAPPAPIQLPEDVGSVSCWVQGTLAYLGHLQDPAPEWSIRNWAGEELYVDGGCFVCGKPWAPRGSFAVAMLPAGPAYFTHDGNNEHEHMSGPNYLPSVVLGIAAVACSVALGLARKRCDDARPRRRTADATSDVIEV